MIRLHAYNFLLQHLLAWMRLTLMRFLNARVMLYTQGQPGELCREAVLPYQVQGLL